MGVFNKLLTAVRGAAPESGDVVEDKQAVNILEQEIRDSKRYLDEAKESLMKLVGDRMEIEQRNIKPRKKAIESCEKEALSALNRGDEAHAAEIAGKIGELEEEIQAQQHVLDGYSGSINQLKQTIRNTERNILSVERELNVLKTMESVQKASSMADKFSQMGNLSGSATDALERIRGKQQQKADQVEAAMIIKRETSGDNLQDKLKSAGIISASASSNTVLERLKVEQRMSNDRVHWVKSNRY
ncbi:MAG: PspA/IM30 family protein [Gammaproteobacteria bacterium]|nr:PspA/IM30 family protein [Gammaproteobacteria bacterium]